MKGEGATKMLHLHLFFILVRWGDVVSGSTEQRQLWKMSLKI
jgi:hypothetical protein